MDCIKNKGKGLLRLLIEYERFVSILSLYILMTTGYLIINRINALREGVYLSFSIDEKIPFIPAFIWIYVLYYITLLAPLLVIKDIYETRRAILCYIMNFVICFSIFLIVPFKIDRPVVEVKDMSTALLFMLFHADHPTNIIPSLHVGNAFLAAIISFHYNRYYGFFWLFFAILIYASTVFIKQHYLIDGIPSIVIAYILYLLFVRHSFLWKKIPLLVGKERGEKS